MELVQDQGLDGLISVDVVWVSVKVEVLLHEGELVGNQFDLNSGVGGEVVVVGLGHLDRPVLDLDGLGLEVDDVDVWELRFEIINGFLGEVKSDEVVVVSDKEVRVRFLNVDVEILGFWEGFLDVKSRGDDIGIEFLE